MSDPGILVGILTAGVTLAGALLYLFTAFFMSGLKINGINIKSTWKNVVLHLRRTNLPSNCTTNGRLRSLSRGLRTTLRFLKP